MKKVFSVILASNSPRRRDILRQIGIDFVQLPVDADEKIRPGERPEDYAERVSLDKARVAAVKAGSGVVIAADTIVALESSILGKPTDVRDAHRMLKLLSGRMHHVITGLTVMDAATGKTVTRTVNTKVWFRELSDTEIEAYIATGEPLDKAGAYGIQEKGALLVNRIEGCYFNVVGLPLAVLGQILGDFGINLL
jgi:septum formation protein